LSKSRIVITREAELDLEGIVTYIAQKESTDRANHVFTELENLILSLEVNAERGHYPEKLKRQGIKDYKEVNYKPYRIIYEVIGLLVIVHICADGRRDFTSLLESRLFR